MGCPPDAPKRVPRMPQPRQDGIDPQQTLEQRGPPQGPLVGTGSQTVPLPQTIKQEPQSSRVGLLAQSMPQQPQTGKPGSHTVEQDPQDFVVEIYPLTTGQPSQPGQRTYILRPPPKIARLGPTCMTTITVTKMPQPKPE